MGGNAYLPQFNIDRDIPIEGNDRIPSTYKDRLHHDVAKVLEICPHAGGLAAELTVRGQRGATGSRGKLGAASNAAIGAAYELIGTAALATKVVRAANPGAPDLHINGQKDIITFGDKSFLNRRSADGVKWSRPSRSSIECDVRIGRPSLSDGYREIGIDFKHVKEMKARNADADFRNQVENVVWALKEGQLHEYHFVTNGRFSGGIRQIVDQANAELVGSGNAPIGLYEYVSTIVNDPTVQTGAP